MKKLINFTVDFEKAYDMVSWEYIDQVLAFMGFGEIWRAWMKALCTNAKSSVLLNRRLTDEFDLHRGLRQGDPMSRFLFIIAMKGLHVAKEDTVANGMFREVTFDC